PPPPLPQAGRPGLTEAALQAEKATADPSPRPSAWADRSGPSGQMPPGSTSRRPYAIPGSASYYPDLLHFYRVPPARERERQDGREWNAPVVDTFVSWKGAGGAPSRAGKRVATARRLPYTETIGPALELPPCRPLAPSPAG